MGEAGKRAGTRRKKAGPAPTITVVRSGRGLARNWFEKIARKFLLQPSCLVDYDLVLEVLVPGSLRAEGEALTFQRAIVAWIRKHGHRSGISEDVFFLSVPGVPVRLRVDTETHPRSFTMRFRAIGR